MLELYGILFWGIVPLREKITKLAQGNIDDSTPLIFVEPRSIEYELTPNTAVKMGIMITSGNGVYVKGLAYSSDTRVKLLNPAFGGSSLRLVAEALLRSTDDEDAFTGQITLVTNGGEFIIPFVFHKKDAEEEHDLSCLNTPEDFADLAEEDKNSALRIFGLSNFCNAPFMRNLRYSTIYREFRKCPDREVALEQFIAACGIRISNYSRESADFGRMCGKSVNKRLAVSAQKIPRESDTYRRHYFEYAKLRLAYDMGRDDSTQLLDGMISHLDAIIDSDRSSEYITLLKAEALYEKGAVRDTLMLMNSVSSAVRDNRQEMIHEYFLLEFLEIVVNHRDKASFIRLCRKFIEEQHFLDLFIYVLRLDEELMSNDIQLRNFLSEVFSYGARSPWLYYYYCMLLNDHPEYLYAPKSIDSHSLHFGRKYHIISDNITQAVVSASCSAYIKSDRKLISAHKTYAEGVEMDLSINGLYEYYLYTLPNDPDYVISDRVLNHYRSGDRLDIPTKTRLYSNIVRFKKKTTALYKSYEDRIVTFALSQLKEQNINDYLLDLYANVIRPEMIDQELSDQYLKLVNCYRIRTDNPHIRSVVITYAAAAGESVFSTVDGNAILPIYYPGEIILFQDAYGNRFYDVPYTKEQLFQQNAFRSAAEKLCPASSVVRIKKTNELMLKRSINGEDVLQLENEVYEKDLNDDAKALIINRLIQYYNQHAATGYNPDFLLKINMLHLSVGERRDLCNAYITCGCFSQAYEMIREFGYKGVTDRNLRLLCTNLIQQGQYLNEQLLMTLCEYTECSNNQDNIILEYMCKSYYGPTEIMYEVLKRSIAARIDTCDLEERLLAQLIFSDDRKYIDEVFEWYVTRRKASESIVKAYFTIKSSSYFFDDTSIDSRIFDYLENAVRDNGIIAGTPLIYIFALTKYYSGLENLSKSRIETAKKLVHFLLDKKYTLDYLKRFERYFTLPGDFMCNQIISYKAAPGTEIRFRSCIRPSEDKLMPETASVSIMNLYIKTKVLFAGETWNYEVYAVEGEETKLIDSGCLSYDDIHSEKRGFKFHELNAICAGLPSAGDDEIIGMMRNYASKENAVRRLFGIGS